MLRILVVFMCLVLGLSTAAAQETDSIKAPRITVGAEEFWLHTVEKGETLYAISRHYNVPQTAIAAVNPHIYYGLQAGVQLRIPIPAELRSGKSTDGFILHTVQAGESLYAIARKYNVEVAKLRSANALVSDTLQLNMILRIPVVASASSSQQQIYEVQKGEGVYGIAKRCGVTQEAIIEANPWLRERNLEVGDKLVIPHNAQSSSTDVDLQTVVVQCDSTSGFPRWKTLQVALLLPFELGKTPRSTDVEEEIYDLPNAASRGVAANTRYLDFYQGILLALDYFRLTGYNIRLSVFDTQRTPSVVQKLLQSDTLRKADLIVGPVYPKNIALVAQYAAQYQIPLVSPLAGKGAVAASPYLYLANPSYYEQIRTLVVRSLRPGTQRIVVLREESLADHEMSEKLVFYVREQCKTLVPQPTVEVLTYPKGSATAKLTPRLKTLLGDWRNTKVFIPSHSEPFVSDLLGQLNSLSVLRQKDTLEIYGMSRWFKMRNLDLAQLGSLRVILFSPFYVDYSSVRVRDFLDTYRAVYRSEPTQYAFQGYDVVKYFVNALVRYGKDFAGCLPHNTPELLQNRFDFRTTSDGTHESRAIFLLQFDLERGLTPLAH